MYRMGIATCVFQREALLFGSWLLLLLVMLDEQEWVEMKVLICSAPRFATFSVQGVEISDSGTDCACGAFL